MVLTVPDGCRWKRTKRSGRESAKLYVSSGSTKGPKDPSTPARRRWDDSNRIAPGSVPVLRDELAVFVTYIDTPLNSYGFSRLSANATV
ncbi:MAG: hypothetical protein JXA30_00540 [Deltaproteobacteria bacterium]|nr:hypothetical protein [Deltaproteobacteria bacterium]